MKKIIFIVGAIIALALILTANVAHSSKDTQVHIVEKVEASEIATTSPEVVAPRFSHQQETWIAALEWCESRADNTAVNWYDKDGTASYYAFQFKPGTLRYFGEKYGVIEPGKSDAEIMELLKVYAVQRAIVEYMVEDPGTRWESQFPGCVRLLGRPPLK